MTDVRMTRELSRPDVHTGEWRPLLSCLGLNLVNMWSFEATDIVATAGFVKTVGPERIVWLWMLTLVLSLFTSWVVSRVIDRVSRRRLVTGLLAGSAVANVCSLLLLGEGVFAGDVYCLLYVVADQQLFLFPVVFAAYANDLFRTHAAKRLYPLIASGASAGSIIGNLGTSALASVWMGRAVQIADGLMLWNVALCTAGIAIALAGVPGSATGPGRLSGSGGFATTLPSATGLASDRSTVWSVASDLLRNVQAMRYLTGSILLVNAAAITVEFHFTTVIGRMDQTTAIEHFLGLYRCGVVVASLLLQWFVAGRLLQRLELKWGFLGLPGVAVVACAGAFTSPGLVGAALGPFLMQTVRAAWDNPLRNAFTAMLPDERRGRTMMFLDSYVPAAGTLAGCVLLVVAQWFGNLAHLPPPVMALGLAVPVLAALGSLWYAIRMRQVYDQSLLNWRFARRRRTSVLDRMDL